jgi:hypothetical protein
MRSAAVSDALLRPSMTSAHLDDAQVDDKIRFADKQAKHLKKGWFSWLVSSDPKQKPAKDARG